MPVILQVRDERHRSVSQLGSSGDAHTQRVGINLEDVTSPVKPAFRKTECSLPAELGIREPDVQREEQASERHTGPSSRDWGLTQQLLTEWDTCILSEFLTPPPRS